MVAQIVGPQSATTDRGEESTLTTESWSGAIDSVTEASIATILFVVSLICYAGAVAPRDPHPVASLLRRLFASTRSCDLCGPRCTTRLSHGGSTAPSSSQTGPVTCVVFMALTAFLAGVYIFYLRRSTVADSSTKYFYEIAGAIALLVPADVSFVLLLQPPRS
ncbi:hypothetical protein GW17_00026615 [Ensete ventricosum]|uniref:Uncharacterized protein n=1 Tax=Ensete ventricosum TaxID=4639 RepID=A0A444EHS2_ENSVE|nr:hypothetical protein GW17_00026615 [Ensete ventricosum]RZR71571.1 hypothetical protein BHM03_00005912 [Ensete ventricosum]